MISCGKENTNLVNKETMTKQQKIILASTKEFAKANNIHYDQMTENMILNALKQQLIMNSCCVNQQGKETQAIEVKQKDCKEAFNIEVEQLGSYRCPSWERCKNICEECAFVNGISPT